MVLYVIEYAVLDRPFEEIQLANGGLHKAFVSTRDRNAVPPTERIESFFGICFQLQLVAVVDFEHAIFYQVFQNPGAHLDHVFGFVFLGVIGDEPVDDPQRYLRLAVHDGPDRQHIGGVFVEIHQILQEEIVLSICRRVISRHLYRFLENEKVLDIASIGACV
jgi:hypothetical protein